MPSGEDALNAGREALVAQKYFDGVQIVNGALEACEEQLLGGGSEPPPTEKLDILRAPEAFLQKMMPKIGEDQQGELAQMYALRADLLVGLGATKRALVDIGAALVLRPDNQALLQSKKEIQAKLEQTDQPATGAIAKTPTTIITGFLGAGKTTLLNHILEAHHGRRVAVIENEFGEVGIDDKLLNTKRSVTEENVVEMNNGCICCTIRGDLIAGLKKLYKQCNGKGKPLDAILIETTGLADPAPVAQTFFADDFVQSHMSLDGILTVVDAKHVMEHVREEKPEGVVNEAVEQLAFADRILLNKTDLVTPEYLEEVQEEIRAINKTAQLRRTQNSKVDMDFIIGIRAFSLDKILDQVSDGFLEEEEEHGHGGGEGHGHGGHGGGDGGQGHDCHEEGCGDPAHGHGGHEGGHEGGHGHGHGHDEAAVHGHGHGHDEACNAESCEDPSHKKTKKPRHAHDYRVGSVGISVPGEVHKDKLDAFIAWLMQEKGPELYRAKGVLAVKGCEKKFVFQAVHMQIAGLPQDSWKEGEERYCKMVFIGKNLKRDELNTKFDECRVK